MQAFPDNINVNELMSASPVQNRIDDDSRYFPTQFFKWGTHRCAHERLGSSASRATPL